MERGIVLAALFAALAGLSLLRAIRFARSQDRDRFWMWLLGLALPFTIASSLVFWKGLPVLDPVPGFYNRGFGPGWRCADVPHADFCIRDAP